MAEKPTVMAVQKALESAKKRNFTETVELAINLKDVDLSMPKNRITDDIILPYGRGKSIRICVIGGGELVQKAKDVADVVITADELQAIADDKKQAKKLANSVDYFIAEAPMMGVVGKRLGTVLGPRGKMPKPIPPGQDPTGMIEALRKTVSVRTKDRITFHAPVGTVSMSPEELAENIDTILKRVELKLEKGRMNIASSYVKTTMGPSERLI
ncbi:MAG: 50S ribosomal protein L1 [Methanomassiliicoccales archaeon]|uniref:50S ribosomal protein L1 n=1 Tax=Candidatus Methanarcanum hacksteinii TaxID=2911857 RepID=UPI002A89F134|nr:50S ribosomal protein L1 [Methanomassiliicoccales archaeon]MDD7479488.1 50S ribosomal protein L1 [Methanomassiliicoccales archaeon]MDY4579950.1 50S ribosomal protein L1 [Candidatus Methanarcanum hacksteinii]